jgi:hypothetical protein
VTTVRTVFTSIDEDEAIRRLDLLVRAFQEDRDTASTARRHGRRVASFTDADLGFRATYDLAVGTGTTVAGDRATTITIEAEPISWRRIKLPVVGRWTNMMDGIEEDVTHWFTCDDPLQIDDSLVQRLQAGHRHELASIELAYAEALAAPTAIEAPGLANVVTRRSLTSRIFAVIALVGLAVGITFSVVDARTEHRLLTDGVRTAAKVLRLPNSDSDEMIIEYEDAGEWRRGAYFEPEGDFRVGQSIPIRMLPGEGKYLIDGEIFMDESTSDAVGFGFLSALVAGPIAVWIGPRSRSLRRGLRSGPFRRVRVVRYRVSSSGNVGVVEIDDGTKGGPRILRLRANYLGSWKGPDPWPGVRLTGELLVAGPEWSERAAVAGPSPLQVIRTRVAPRRQRWQHWLDRKPETPVGPTDS